MYSLVARALTIVKDAPIQSTAIPPDPNRKYTVLPGKKITTSFLELTSNNHWKVVLDGKTWYIYSPHWTLTSYKIPVTRSLLQQGYKHTSVNIIDQYVESLNEAVDRYQVNVNKFRLFYFLAQIGHESGGLRFTVELASGEAYNNRRDLGNVFPGDGPRYKGRGLIQLTGRANYRNAGRALGLDLENNPELAASPKHSPLIAGWFWNSRNLNFWADKQDFRQVTKLINGGYNGWSDRLTYLNNFEQATR